MACGSRCSPARAEATRWWRACHRILRQLTVSDHSDSHSHSHSREAEGGALKTALVLIVTFMVAEVTVGVLASSLALLSDAAHMLTDAVALAISLVAARLAARPAQGIDDLRAGRAEILSAQANGVTLLVLSILIVDPCGVGLVSPPARARRPVLIVALAGMAVNLAAGADSGSGVGHSGASTSRGPTATSSPTSTASLPPRSRQWSSSPPASIGPTRSPPW